MARTLFRSKEIDQRGTRFRLYPQPPVLSSVRGHELVWVSPPPGTIGPGPADDRMYVVDALDKTPYQYPYLPPYHGPRHRPVRPGPDGHFDHLTDSRSREFMAAHMYGTLRFVLDVWEKYFGGPLPWHFQEDRPRLELVPLVQWNNAHSGYGFIETGFARPVGSEALPFCLNFDVLAHELGHSFVYALLGTPPEDRAGSTYFAFQESAADCVALIAAMHFDSVVDGLLARTSGNIYLPNELNRIGEISETTEIRLASQSLTLADVPDQRIPIDSLSQPERHAMSLPLTGAIFDMFVDMFQMFLVRDGLISPELDALSRPEVSAADEATGANRIRQRLRGTARRVQSVVRGGARLHRAPARECMASPLVGRDLRGGGRRARRRGRLGGQRRRLRHHSGEPGLARDRVPFRAGQGVVLGRQRPADRSDPHSSSFYQMDIAPAPR